ncbi:MAG: hypothetical protein ACREBH_01915 [Candidatus Micrarchaeaceae archaeon]
MPADLGIYTVAVTLIAIMFSVSGIALGLGYAIGDKKLREFGVSEIYQALINGAIVGSLIIGFSSGGFFTVLINGIAGSASMGFSCSQSMSGNYAICFAYNYLVGLNPVTINNVAYPTLIDSSIGLLVPISALYTGLGLLSSIKLSIGIASVGFSSALTPVLTALDYIVEILTAAVIGIEVQGILLNFISIVAIPVLLPVGMVLRTVYVTRRLGGAIMAVAIGLFAVFPLTYVLNASLASSYLTSISSSSINSFISGETSANNNIIGKATQLGGSDNDTFAVVGYFTSAIGSLVNGFEGFLSQLSDIVALIVIEVFFLPVFSLILTAISIRELARILGSEISFGRLYLL